jgi:hypothetical protein
MNQEQRRALTTTALILIPLIAYIIAPQFVAGAIWNVGLFIEGVLK